MGQFAGHGPANYKFQKDEDPSFYVKLRVTDSRDGSLRERYVWGRDLERAIEESVTRPQIGELIGLRRTGQKAVTITVSERDAAGNVIGERERLVNRYTWAVEKVNYFAERATTARVLREAHQDVRRAAREHPELAANLIALKAAELLAAERLRNTDDRRDFIKEAAERIAQRAERGEAVPRARLRERAPASQEPPERDPTRDPPVRG